MKLALRAFLLTLTLSTSALADNACQYIGIIWRYGTLSMKDGRPIVRNEWGTYLLPHDDDVDWVKVDVATMPPNGLVPFGYSYDQFTQPQRSELEFPSGPKIGIKGKSEQAKDNPSIWIQSDDFEIDNGTMTRTLKFEGIREFGHAYKNPSDPNLIYLMPQDTSDEDASCGPDDGPGVIELNASSLTSRLLFKTKPFTPNAGAWSIQISSNTAWMLTSTGICRGNLVTESRVCWSYGKGTISNPGNVHPFVMGNRPTDVRPIAMTIPNPVEILGGRKPGFDARFFIEIEPSSFYKGRGERVYLDKSEIEPILTKEGDGRTPN